VPTYTVQGPSGRTYEIEGPEGASADQLGQFILSQSKEERVALQQQQDRAQYDPTKDMSTTERVLAGAGKGMTDLARGAGQFVGLVDRADVAESRKLDAPLMNTTSGKVGNFIGKAVPLAATSVLIPGANTLIGAGAIGAGAGAIEPSESTGETLKNIAIGAGAGVAGQKIGNTVADWLTKRATNKAAQFAAGQAANAQRLQAAREASSAGYVIPPSDVQPQGVLTEALGGLSGKIKTAQVASAKNEAVTGDLARKAVGLQSGDELTRDTLKAVRDQAGQAYDQFRSVGQVAADKTYNAALDTVESTLKGAQRSFPGLKSDDVGDLVKTMRQPSFDAGDAIDATKMLRGLAEDAYSAGNKTLGKAYRNVSTALEDALDRHLANTAPDAVKQFRSARELIAKTYTVENALNSQTGQVSAQKLAMALQKGKPLSGELRTIAETAQAFPKATQSLKEAPKAVSPLDWMMAGGMSAATSNPLALAALGARPAARSIVLSPAMQRAAMADLSAPTSRLADLSSNELMRLLYGPVAAAGVNSGQ
jgi:hypothetical protein